MLPGGVALTLGVDRAVDAPLSADGVRTLHRNERKKVDLQASLTGLDDCHQAGQASPNYNNPWSHLFPPQE
jgi:hypothetical protein